jgi:plastocyanin
MTRPLRSALGALAVLACTALAAPAGAATPITLNGTVGPGFTITLAKTGKKVTTLKAGSYKLVIADKAAIHDFHLMGPGGLSKVITSVSFTGTKSLTLTLKKGTYTYVCDPHKAFMHGSFKVV